MSKENNALQRTSLQRSEQALETAVIIRNYSGQQAMAAYSECKHVARDDPKAARELMSME